MRLTAPEPAMLDGAEGPAVQNAMDLLVRHGEALSAEKLVDTNNVCATVGATTHFIRDFAAQRYIDVKLRFLIAKSRYVRYPADSRVHPVG